MVRTTALHRAESPFVPEESNSDLHSMRRIGGIRKCSRPKAKKADPMMRRGVPARPGQRHQEAQPATLSTILRTGAGSDSTIIKMTI